MSTTLGLMRSYTAWLESGLPLSVALAAAAVPVSPPGPADGVEFDGAVEWSIAMPPSATATPSTASSTAISVLRLCF